MSAMSKRKKWKLPKPEKFFVKVWTVKVWFVCPLCNIHVVCQSHCCLGDECSKAYATKWLTSVVPGLCAMQKKDMKILRWQTLKVKMSQRSSSFSESTEEAVKSGWSHRGISWQVQRHKGWTKSETSTMSPENDWLNTRYFYSLRILESLTICMTGDKLPGFTLNQSSKRIRHKYIQSPTKVLEHQGQFFCFCCTLKTFALEIKKWICNDRLKFHLAFEISEFTKITDVITFQWVISATNNNEKYNSPWETSDTLISQAISG